MTTKINPIEGISWNKIFVLASAFGIPLVSILFWLVTSGTHLVDKVNAMEIKITEQGKDITQIKARVDTIAQHQHDDDLLKKYGVRYSLGSK